MFIEPQTNNQKYKNHFNKGWIEVIVGSMFSGKTEELIRRMNRASIAGQNVEIFKPSIDTRYSDSEVVSHNNNSIVSTPVDFAQDILLFSGNCDVIGIDEAQFFDEQLVDVVSILANQGKRVLVAGLDMDFEAKPFGFMPSLMATADYVTKLHAICMKCGDLAQFTYRIGQNRKQVELGEKDLYEARCRHCYNEGLKEQTKDVAPDPD